MTSKIRGDDNFDSEGIVTGTAKAWVFFNGKDVTEIYNSFNVLGITDNGTGDYSAHYITTLDPSGNAFVGSVDDADNPSNIGTVQPKKTGGLTPTHCRFETAVANSSANRTNIDCDYVSVVLY